MARRIQLGGHRRGSQIGYALVDDEDYERLSKYTWTLAGRASRRVAIRRTRLPDGSYEMVLMHRDVLGVGPEEPRMVDHVNHDSLDNRKANLRLVTNAENQRNRREQGRGYFHDARYEQPWAVIVRFATEAEADEFVREHIPHRRLG